MWDDVKSSTTGVRQEGIGIQMDHNTQTAFNGEKVSHPRNCKDVSESKQYPKFIFYPEKLSGKIF